MNHQRVLYYFCLLLIFIIWTNYYFYSTQSLSQVSPEFFVITTIFNPASFAKRYELYHAFVQHMSESGVQLITIECIFPFLGQPEFQVTNSNNPNHIQLKSDSVYWLQANLINIAAARLPPQAKWICWLDAEIHFDEPNWVRLTLETLEKYIAVQMFQFANILGPQNEIFRIDRSFGECVVNKISFHGRNCGGWFAHAGFGWAMSRHHFLGINGLPDYHIAGGFDTYFAYPLLNVTPSSPNGLTLEYKQMIADYSKNSYAKLSDWSKIEKKEIVGRVSLNITHYWHGSKTNRQYVQRWNILSTHKLRPAQDLYRNSDGLLQFVPKNQSSRSIQDDLIKYFQNRHEDSNKLD